MMKLNTVTWIAMILTVVGGLNWGLVGLFGFDLVRWLFTDTLGVEFLARLVYIVVGVSAVILLVSACGQCGKAEKGE